MKKVTKGMYRDSLSDSKLHFLSGVILRRSILLAGYHLLIYDKMDARVICQNYQNGLCVPSFTVYIYIYIC
jgi:hypothetical protein